MIRAVVMSFKGSRAIVLAEGGRFMRVPRRPQYEVGDEIELEPEEAAESRRRAVWQRRVFLPAAACCAAVALFVVSAWWPHTPAVVAYVTLDVNPSLELGIDGKERVRSLDALNADAEPIVAGISYKGKDVEEVAGELAEQLASRHLLHGGSSEIVLASVPVGEVSGQWEAEVTAKMKRAIEEAGEESADKGGAAEPGSAGSSGNGAAASPSASADTAGGGDGATPPATSAASGQPPAAAGGPSDAAAAGHPAASVPVVTTVSVPKEVRDAAREMGLSAGKMAFWLKARSEGHEVALDTLKKESLKKIAAAWGGIQKILVEDGAGNGSKDADSTSGNEWKQLLDQSLAKHDGTGAAAPGVDKSGHNNQGANNNQDAKNNKGAKENAKGKPNGSSSEGKDKPAKSPSHRPQANGKPQLPSGSSWRSGGDSPGSGQWGQGRMWWQPSPGQEGADDAQRGSWDKRAGGKGAGGKADEPGDGAMMTRPPGQGNAERMGDKSDRASDVKRGGENGPKNPNSGRDKSDRSNGRSNGQSDGGKSIDKDRDRGRQK